MPRNIKTISLWEDNPQCYNNIPLVKVDFEFPCTWTVLDVEDIKKILRLWIEGEERVYPESKGFRGRWLLYDELKAIFQEGEWVEVK